MEIPKSFLGYKRENGRAGTRNHVIILPVDDISNACAEAVANNIKGTIALPHSYGRLQFGADLDLHFRTMIGTGKNPNVAAVIVIGIEPKWTKRIVDAIAATGKPVEGFHIERTGDIGTIMKASKKAQEFSQWASEKQREECPMSDLWISVKCGESDTTSGLASNPTVGNLMEKLEPLGVHLCFGETSELTGAETVCATRGATPEAKEKFMKTWNGYNDFILKEATDDLSESQPTAGNIAGGLTTIEEKAFGNFQKIGNLKFIDVLEPAEEPKKHLSFEEILGRRADYALALATINTAYAAVNLEKSKRIPDVEVTVFVERERSFFQTDGLSHNTMAGLGVSVPIPFRQKNADVIEQARFDRIKAERKSQALRFRVGNEYAQALRGTQDAWRLAKEASGEILQLAQKNLTDSQSAYRQGQTSLLRVQRAQEQLLAQKNAALEAIVNFHLTKARLREVMGDYPTPEFIPN